MFTEIKKLIKSSAIYAFGNLSGRFLSFLLLPLYTRYLTPAEYGILAVVNVFGSILQIVANFGFQSSVVKVYFEVEKKRERDEVISTAFFTLIALALSMAFVLWIFRDKFAGFLLDNPAYGIFIGISIFSSFIIIIKTIPLSILRAKEKAVNYTVLAFLTLFLGIVLNLIFVIVLKENVKGILKSTLISQSIVFCFALVPFGKDLVLKFNKQYLKAMLTFGLPLVPSGLAIWILTLLDRYFLKIFTTMEMVGIYSLGYRISSIMSIVVIVPFSMAWSPLMLKWQKEPNAREIYANTFRYFCIGAFFAALVLASLSKEVIMLMTTEAFHNAYKIVYFIVLAYLFHGIYMIFTTGCTIVRKTYFFAIATGIAAIMNTGLNILLIPRFEMMGAAIATVISYFCMTFILYIFSERFYHIPFDFFTFLKAGIIATGLYLAGFIFNANLAISILVKIAILMVYFPLLLIAGVFNKKEIQFGKLILERWLRR